jgi:hypothetical protein
MTSNMKMSEMRMANISSVKTCSHHDIAEKLLR